MRNRSSTWYAADLERYDNEYKANLLSSHKGIINLQVENWPHLLMVAKSGFERGPCTIGLEHEYFFELQKIAEHADEISFNGEALTFCFGNSWYSINWREGERLSFAPYKIVDLDHNKALSAINKYSNALEKIDLITSSAVLLGMNGGADYFRLEIKKYFPVIIKSLLLKNEQEFINACRKLIGMGHGSSPNGDDLVCGALLAYHHFIADQLFIDNISAELKDAAEKTNLMGGHMLEIGRSGLAPDVFKALLTSISRGSFEPELLKRTMQVGSSTGIDLMIALITFTLSYLEFKKNYAT